MGTRNYLIEGVSGTGKTTVCNELRRRGFHAINGDRELAYQGDPDTGIPTDGFSHEHHIWSVERVKILVADRSHAASFFCGGSRNFASFIGLFDGVFILQADLPTLNQRLLQRTGDEWGAEASQRESVARLHATKEDTPQTGTVIDATMPVECVVDAILRGCT